MKRSACKPAAWVCLVFLLAVVACQAPAPRLGYETDPALAQVVAQPAPPYPPASWVVFSDPHWFDPDLVDEGPAFEAYLASDRKMLRESPELLDAMVRALTKVPADFVLIPGDLTKDGEASSHAGVVAVLRGVEATGKKVYVVPGNHDVLSAVAVGYRGGETYPVPSITPAEFADLYADFGYAEAIARDPSSLSYVAEPVPGLWLLALDTCRYLENQPGSDPLTAGRLSAATLSWAEAMLARAVQESKAVIAMAHHGLMEHFRGQTQDFGAYVVEDYARVSRLLGQYNVRLAFTGHYHAQDITLARWGEYKFLFDVQTGSLVTYPMPYRHVQIAEDQTAILRALYIASIASMPQGLVEYARETTRDGIVGIAADIIQGYRVGAEEAGSLAEQIGEAYLAHYAGDESLPVGQEKIRTSGLSLPAWLVVMYRKGLVESLWEDLPPPDNDLVIDLRTGDWK